MEDLSYTYLHCDLLDRVILTIVTLKVKSPHVNMHEHYVQKEVFLRVENFNIERDFERGFEKGDVHVVIIVELTTIEIKLYVCIKLIHVQFLHFLTSFKL
jgi:hypothetical protein